MPEETSVVFFVGVVNFLCGFRIRNLGINRKILTSRCGESSGFYSGIVRTDAYFDSGLVISEFDLNIMLIVDGFNSAKIYGKCKSNHFSYKKAIYAKRDHIIKHFYRYEYLR